MQWTRRPPCRPAEPLSAGYRPARRGAPADDLIAFSDIRAAAARISGVAVRTPLLPVEHGRDRVWLKCESFQPTGAFKLRGAYNFLACLDPAERARGVVTYSSGNHAQAVAYAARAFGVPATVVMPTDAPATKVDATRRFGASVELCGTLSTEREERAREIASESGLTVVPPFDHPNIIAGQGTVALEIADQLARLAPEAPAVPDEAERAPEAPVLLVPIGGGGLISGVAAAARALFSGGRVVGVEPEGAASMAESLRAGRPVPLEHIETIADGLRPVSPGEITYRHCAALVDEVVTVSDEAIRRGVRWCFDRRLVVEPSGAAGVAAMLEVGIDALRDGRSGPFVIVISGGNIGWRRLRSLLADAV